MADEQIKYDVAISFLVEDLPVAQALYTKLAEEGLEVFFFPHNQEELAGTDGLESMPEVFRRQSRLNLVVYREKWGKTRWTAVEERAVRESLLDTSYKSVFVFVVGVKGPDWIPETHIYFSSSYPIDQAVGAIKARVQERGGEFKPLTPARKAELLRAEEDYQRARRSIYSSDGLMQVFESVKFLFAEIQRQCEEINAAGHVRIEHQTKLLYGDIDQTCMLGEHGVGMVILWLQRYSNTMDDTTALYVREFNQNLIVPEGFMRVQQPEMIGETKYEPELSRAREHGWKAQTGKGNFISTSDLASRLLLQFLDMIERDRTGKIQRSRGW